MQAVVVGCSDGKLYFLDIVTGRQLAVVDTGGTIKSPPAVDGWQDWGCVWMASHGRRLLACTSQGIALDCGGAHLACYCGLMGVAGWGLILEYVMLFIITRKCSSDWVDPDSSRRILEVLLQLYP